MGWRVNGGPVTGLDFILIAVESHWRVLSRAERSYGSWWGTDHKQAQSRGIVQIKSHGALNWGFSREDCSMCHICNIIWM